MRSRRAALAALAAGAVGSTLALSASPALAVPDPPAIGAHRHFVVTPDGGRHAVGPQICENPALQDAFSQFHLNVHRGTPGVHAFGHNDVSIDALPC